jgi:hypothetical protein
MKNGFNYPILPLLTKRPELESFGFGDLHRFLVRQRNLSIANRESAKMSDIPCERLFSGIYMRGQSAIARREICQHETFLVHLLCLKTHLYTDFPGDHSLCITFCAILVSLSLPHL